MRELGVIYINTILSITNTRTTYMWTILTLLKPFKKVRSMPSVPTFTTFQKSLTFMHFLATYFTNVAYFFNSLNFHNFLFMYIDVIKKAGHFDRPIILNRLLIFSFYLKPHTFQFFQLFMLIRKMQYLLIELIIFFEERILY